MINSIIKKLLAYSKLHDLNKGLTNEEIQKFEVDNGIILPNALKEVYSCFDGGELFVPGTTVYGLKNGENSIRTRNSRVVRQKMSLTANYLIIAKLNYGDYICVDLSQNNKVIQWSHESDEGFCEWDNLEQWLSEMITDYEEYEAGEQA